MDLLKMGQQLLGDKLGDKAGGMMEALSGLTSGEGLDLGGIMEKMKTGGMGDQLDSFLGDGENQELSADQVKSAFGEEGLSNVANKLGVDSDTAASQLKDILPGLLDKASSGGNLMESLTGGGAGGLLDMAKGFLKK
ncbi:MAG: YidB family protein [Granulosicoccaceae bacterium]